MEPIVFRQSDVKDPYRLYDQRLRESPIHRDPDSRLWGIYGYEECKTILSHPSTAIPVLNPGNRDGLHDMAWRVQNHLVRIANPPQHEIARWAGMHLMDQMLRPSITEILEACIGPSAGSSGFDWVSQVGKVLPVALMAKSFGFEKEISDYIAANIASLTRIMSPDKTSQQVTEINRIITDLFPMVHRHLLASAPYPLMADTLCRQYSLKMEEAFFYLTSNLIGLFIQGYDACRGLLCTALLSALGKTGADRSSLSDKKYMEKCVVETLRYDPTVHNTRRLVTADLSIGDKEIKKDDILFIILAAANRDPRKFEQPDRFTPDRANNKEHMTLGSGPHYCLAKYYAVAMAVETLACLFERYTQITWMENELEFEPLINIRMPKKVIVTIRR
jgi:cytochrome P450